MKPDSIQTFTSRKLDWQQCVSFDPRVTPLAFEVGCCILRHVSHRNYLAQIADQTIAEEIHSSWRNVLRARAVLLRAGWLTWKRTRNASVYEIQFGQVERHLDMFIADRERRKEGYKRRKSRVRALPNLAGLKSPDVPNLAGQELPQLADKHLERNTLSKRAAEREAYSEVVGSRGPVSGLTTIPAASPDPSPDPRLQDYRDLAAKLTLIVASDQEILDSVCRFAGALYEEAPDAFADAIACTIAACRSARPTADVIPLKQARGRS